MRPKDASDFAAVLPRLAPHQRHWLREALMVVHPDHSWLAELPEGNSVLNTAERKFRGSESYPLRHWKTLVLPDP
jgi:hypothetical protein